MLNVEKKAVKSIDEYRHNIQLLKYHLKKEKKTNDNLKYEAAKIKHRPIASENPRNRIYELNETVQIVSNKLKRMGLSLEDVFRMADNHYEGEISKEQFMKVIGRLKTELADTLFAVMFNAIDTSQNGSISEDEFLEFSIAYGGCTDIKEVRKFQNKAKTKLLHLLNKKHGNVEKFLKAFEDPIRISELSSQFRKMGLSENEVMMMLKTLDPELKGEANHKSFISTMSDPKIKTEKEQEVSEFKKTIEELCIIFRDKKINPMMIFSEADVDGKDGVSSFELEQAFKSILPGETTFQIKKWVELINFNKDEQISKEEFYNSIRGFYEISQLNNFNKETLKKHPELKKLDNPSEPSIEKILSDLSIAIESKGLKRKAAFESIDINKSGDIDKEELLYGLESLGIAPGLILRVMSVFDVRNGDGKIDLEEWLNILGADAEMSEVELPDDIESENEKDKKKKPDMKKNKKEVSKGKDTKDTKISKEKDVKISSKKEEPKSKIGKENDKTKAADSPKKILEESKKKSEIKPKVSEIEKQEKLKKEEISKSNVKLDNSKIDKKDSLIKKETKGVNESKDKKVITNKKFEEDEKEKNEKSMKKEEEEKKNSKGESGSKVIKKDSKVEKKESKVQIKKTESKLINESKISVQKVESEQEEEEENVDGNESKFVEIEERIGKEYKKNKKNSLAYFKEFENNNKKGLLKKAQFCQALEKKNVSLMEKEKDQFFERSTNSGEGVKYEEWLEKLAEDYAEDVEEEPSPKESPKRVIKKIVSKEVNEEEEDEGYGKEDFEEESIKNKSELSVPSESNKSKRSITDDQKRGSFKEFSKLVDLIIPKSGERVEEGYKLIDYISDNEDPDKLRRERDQLLKKAKEMKDKLKNKKELKVPDMFKDQDFQPVLGSIFEKGEVKNIVDCEKIIWKHYKEIYPNDPQVFHESIHPNDIKQGRLGDCYFLSALSGLAEYPNLIERLFEFYDLEIGYFLIWLCIDGAWRLVELDGYFPVYSTNPNAPAFTYSADEELWVLLLEKAYAKCYGNYNRINGGITLEAIKDLSGSPGYPYYFDKKNERNLSGNENNYKNLYSDEDIFRYLLEGEDKKYILTAGTDKNPNSMKIEGRQEGVNKEGIVEGHAYTILDVRLYKGEKLIKLRNPWGLTEWEGGSWSDKGNKWTKEILQEFQHEINEKDGIFWMPLEPFYRNFLSCSVNCIHPSYHYRYEKVLGWKEFSVKIKMSSFKNGYLSVSHKDQRHSKIVENTKPIPYDGTYYLNGYIECNGKIIKSLPQKREKFQREQFVEFNELLDPKDQKDSYAIILVSLAKSTEVTVGFYSDSKADFEIERECEPYFEKIGIFERGNEKTKKQTNSHLETWEMNTLDRTFAYFKNISSQILKIDIKIKKIEGYTMQSPFTNDGGVLEVKPGEMKYFIYKYTGGSVASCEYGISLMISK